MNAAFATIFWRDMIKFWRGKAMLFATLAQPALWMILFGVAMSSSLSSYAPPGPIPPGFISVSYMTFMSTGVVAMTVLFTCLFAGIAIFVDAQYGNLREVLASPMPRSQVLVGLTLGSVARSLVQVGIILAIGLLLGVALFPGFSVPQVLLGVLGMVFMVVLFAIGLMFLSTLIALKVKSHGGVQAVVTLLVLPMFFASNALYPLQTLPDVIKAIAYVNPMTYFIDGFRAFCLGDSYSALGVQFSTSGVDVVVCVAFLGVFAAIFYVLTIRAFNRASMG